MTSCVLDVAQLQSLVLFPLPILSLLWEVCSVILRIVQHKIFIVGAVVILAVIGLLIFGIVMIKRGNSGGSGGGMNG